MKVNKSFELTAYPSTALQGKRQLNSNLHLASLRDPRLEEFPVGGESNKLKVRLGIRNLAALPFLAMSGSKRRNRAASA